MRASARFGTVLVYEPAGESDARRTMAEYFIQGDPERDSTRRHLERVLSEPQSRRWPWFLGMLAGGAAFTFWRTRAQDRSLHGHGSSRKPPELTAR